MPTGLFKPMVFRNIAMSDGSTLEETMRQRWEYVMSGMNNLQELMSLLQTGAELRISIRNGRCWARVPWQHTTANAMGESISQALERLDLFLKKGEH